MERIHDDSVAIGEVFSESCPYIIGIEVFLIIASDDEHVIPRATIREVAVSEFLASKRCDDRMTLREFIFYLFDGWIIDNFCFEISSVVFRIELGGLGDGCIDSAAKYFFLESGHGEYFFLELGQ